MPSNLQDAQTVARSTNNSPPVEGSQTPPAAADVFFGANYNDSPGTPESQLPNPILTQFRLKK